MNYYGWNAVSIQWTFEPYGTQSAFYLITALSKYLIKLKISSYTAKTAILNIRILLLKLDLKFKKGVGITIKNKETSNKLAI